MTNEIHERQPSVVQSLESKALSYFQRGWENSTPMDDYPTDSLTPWFQVKIQQLSPTARTTLMMVFNITRLKPLNTPFTLEDILPPQESFGDTAKCSGSFRRVGGRRSLSIPLSQSLSDLKEIGVLRLATPEEKHVTGAGDGRLNLYLFAYPRIEQWWRDRTCRQFTSEQSQSLNIEY